MGSLSKSRSSSGSTKTASRRAGQVWNAAEAAGNNIPQPILQSQGTFGGAQTAGQQGLDAMTGNVAAAQKFMNPYQTQVADEMTKQFGIQNKMTEQQMADAATRSGAFGGSRHGVATGVALGENARNQSMQMAGLLNQGFEGAMGRAGQVAGMGMQGAQMGANLGMTAGSPDLWRLEMRRRGLEGMPGQQVGRSSGFGGSYSPTG